MNGNARQWLTQTLSGLASPAILMTVVWAATLLLVANGPIIYPGQPSAPVLTVVVFGLAIFLLCHWAGKLAFDRWFEQRAKSSHISIQVLNKTVMAASLLGITGIALLAFDRTVLSGVNNSTYSELLRCAPHLVDTVMIRRTPLLYVGYATFSFGFVSVMLFLLHGEEIRGWAAALAQLSIVSPIGYAILYSGRMPILFVLVLVAMSMLVRVARGRTLLPHGHYLVLKTTILVGLFAVYSSAIWSSRQSFCVQMSPLITELQKQKDDRLRNLGDERTQENQTVGSKATEMITPAELNKRFAEAQAQPRLAQTSRSTATALETVLDAWNVQPRGYITSAIETGRLSPRGAMIGIATYFYLTHGVRTVDYVWSARDKFKPHWGVYEIGVLSPLLRIFFPESDRIADMEAEQRAAFIYGFFPSAWAAAFIDFGLVGAIVYVMIWGGLAGWSAAGSRHSRLMTPLLLLVFMLSTVLLSPIQGPLGMANSALVLVSTVVTGLVLDFITLRAVKRDAVRSSS